MVKKCCCFGLNFVFKQTFVTSLNIWVIHIQIIITVNKSSLLILYIVLPEGLSVFR